MGLAEAMISRNISAKAKLLICRPYCQFPVGTYLSKVINCDKKMKGCRYVAS